MLRTALRLQIDSIDSIAAVRLQKCTPGTAGGMGRRDGHRPPGTGGTAGGTGQGEVTAPPGAGGMAGGTGQRDGRRPARHRRSVERDGIWKGAPSHPSPPPDGIRKWESPIWDGRPLASPGQQRDGTAGWEPFGRLKTGLPVGLGNCGPRASNSYAWSSRHPQSTKQALRYGRRRTCLQELLARVRHNDVLLSAVAGWAGKRRFLDWHMEHCRPRGAPAAVCRPCARARLPTPAPLPHVAPAARPARTCCTPPPPCLGTPPSPRSRTDTAPRAHRCSAPGRRPA